MIDLSYENVWGYVMLVGYEYQKWVKLHNLILNRIAYINQVHLCRYDYANTNPCTLSNGKGWFRASYFGEPLVTWTVDVDSVEEAFRVIDLFGNCLWRVRRAKRLVL